MGGSHRDYWHTTASWGSVLRAAGMRVRHDRRVLLQIARKEAEELDAAISTIESEHARLCRLWHMKEVQIGILTDQLQQEVSL